MANPFDLMGMVNGDTGGGMLGTPFDFSNKVTAVNGGGQGTLTGFINRLMQNPNATPTPQTSPQVPTPPSSPSPVSLDLGGVGHPAADTLPPVVKAFLNATAKGESNGKYNVRYSPKGDQIFSDYSQHPGIMEPGPAGPSSAAGRYQFTKTTWDNLGGGSFDPVSQDIRAWQLADQSYYAKTGRDLQTDLTQKGFTPQIARALSGTWPSFKGSYQADKAIFEKSLATYSPAPSEALTQAQDNPSLTMPEILQKHNDALQNILTSKTAMALPQKQQIPMAEGGSGIGGSSGGALRSADMIPELEGYMGEYAKGNLTAKELQKAFKLRGWTIDLKGNKGIVPTYDPQGNEHMLQF